MPAPDPVWSADELDQTPEKCRARVIRLATQLAQAELMLQRARDEELEADQALQVAEFEAQLSAQAPKVERGGATVADKAAWVAKMIQPQRFQRDIAQKKRVIAQEHYKRVDTQCTLAQSVLRSVDNSFGRTMSGRDGSW